MSAVVAAVSCSAAHYFSKPNQESIRLLIGLGVEGDSHSGETVKHRARVAIDPSKPNLRQVHLIHMELYAELQAAGFDISAGQMGENITTQGVDLLGLPTGARLRIQDAVVEVTGLRNPCYQLDDFRFGLTKATLDHDEQGNLIRKAGIMGIVLSGGQVSPGDTISVDLPPEPHQPLEPV
ncbi:MAG: MOSC domain-containing protein [Chloroflexota bacterium]|nr:MOSC domain-containing protein [Chloroflexota bacterium]